jgi:hypothetical protein
MIYRSTRIGGIHAHLSQTTTFHCELGAWVQFVLSGFSRQAVSMTRYQPQRELPPYSYVPGQFPHPLSHPQGHSYGTEVDEPIVPAEDSWDKCGSYLWGVDLFNNGFYWEAHEAWETAWIAAGRKGVVADFLKSLIKLAAAGVKVRENRPTGVQRHALRCIQLLRQLDNQNQFFGLNVSELTKLARWVSGQAESLCKKAIDDPKLDLFVNKLVLKLP